MQPIAEKYLIEVIVNRIPSKKDFSEKTKLLNIGSGKSLVIEHSIDLERIEYECDRLDVEPNYVTHKNTNKIFNCSVEKMPLVASEYYDIAFSNFVLEHIEFLEDAAREIFRILKDKGMFIATVPNPKAFEFYFAQKLPLRVKEILKGKEVWKTFYNYKDINDLTRIFEEAGFLLVDLKRWPELTVLFSKRKLLKSAGALYDKALLRFRFEQFFGHACLTFQKTKN